LLEPLVLGGVFFSEVFELMGLGDLTVPEYFGMGSPLNDLDLVDGENTLFCAVAGAVNASDRQIDKQAAKERRQCWVVLANMLIKFSLFF